LGDAQTNIMRAVFAGLTERPLVQRLLSEI